MSSKFDKNIVDPNLKKAQERNAARSHSNGLGSVDPSFSRDSSSDELGEKLSQEQAQIQTRPGGSSLLSGLGSKAKAGGTVKKIKKAKKVMTILAPISPFLGVIFIGAVLVASSLIAINIFASEILDGGEKILNVLTLQGFHTDLENISRKIEKAAGDCEDCFFSGYLLNPVDSLDKGILYATINDHMVAGPDIYDNVDNNGKEEDIDDISSTGVLDIIHEHTFYTMKEDMLGEPDKFGTMINSLIGSNINVSCVNSNEYDAGTNAKAYTKYFTRAVLNSASIGVDFSLEAGKYGAVFVFPLVGTVVTAAQLADLAKDIASYADQGSNYLETKLREVSLLAADTPISNISADLANVAAETDACIAAGKKAKYETVVSNDYATYYNYIAKVYTPTIYNKYWNNYSKEEKTRIIKSTWGSIVDVRNDYYKVMGIDSTLVYSFDQNGAFSATVLGDGQMSGGTGYISDIPVGTAGSSWKQSGSSWSNIKLGTGDTTTMSRIGCYVTSISILMANSGTQINSETFDPGVLANELVKNDSFTPSGALRSHNWQNLAPNFVQVTRADNLLGTSKTYVASVVSGYLNQGYFVSLRVKSGGHYVAVTGIENGRIVIADPGKSATPTYLDDDRLYPPGTIKGIRVFKDTTR